MARGKLSKRGANVQAAKQPVSLPSPPASPTPSLLRPSLAQPPAPTTSTVSIDVSTFDFEQLPHESARPSSGGRASSRREPSASESSTATHSQSTSPSPSLHPVTTSTDVIPPTSALSTLRAKLSSDDMARTVTEQKELGVGKLRKRRPRTVSLEGDDRDRDAASVFSEATEVEGDERLDRVIETTEPELLVATTAPTPVTTIIPASPSQFVDPSGFTPLSFVLLGPRLSLSILSAGISTTVSATKTIITLPLAVARRLPFVNTFVSAPPTSEKAPEDQRINGVRQTILNIAELGMCSALVAIWAGVAVGEIVRERITGKKATVGTPSLQQ